VRTVIATKRLWLPFLAAALCLLATRWTGPVLTWVAMLAAMAFILDGATLLFSRGGGMSGHRQ
jgi:hypothetical protein